MTEIKVKTMDDFYKELFLIAALITIVGLLILLTISIPVFLINYYSSCREAKIFNARYGTNYSCGDFFWAGNQIQRQIQTIRLEGLEK